MKNTYRTDLLAEAFCRIALRLKGYRILASRYRSPLGEIDIITLRGKIVALIKAKARGSQREAIGAISMRQRQRLERAANDFLARKPDFHSHHLRFDVMPVSPRRWPLHIKDAWRPEQI